MSRETADSRRRIIESAANLFSKGGYNGASTRDIAQLAQINEATIFRHFPRKRDLYLAVLESELRKVGLRGDLLAEVAGATDARGALSSTYALITATLNENQELLRLIQFSSLELGEDLDPLLRKYLRELVEVLAGYLQSWIDQGQMQCSNARTIILTFVAIVLNDKLLSTVFSEDPLSPAVALEAHADVCNVIASRL